MKRIVSGILIIVVILLVGLTLLVVSLPEEEAETNTTLNGTSYEALDTLKGPYPSCPYYDDCTYDGTRKYKNRQQ